MIHLDIPLSQSLSLADERAFSMGGAHLYRTPSVIGPPVNDAHSNLLNLQMRLALLQVVTTPGLGPITGPWGGGTANIDLQLPAVPLWKLLQGNVQVLNDNIIFVSTVE
jgi:hypothetical protein